MNKCGKNIIYTTNCEIGEFIRPNYVVSGATKIDTSITGFTTTYDCNLLGNNSFEEFAECGGPCTGSNCQPPTTFKMYPKECVPFWDSQESNIEIWKSGFIGTPPYSGGVPAFKGEYFAEIHADTAQQALFQSFQTTPNTPYKISFAHRGRLGATNTMRVAISGSTNGVEFIGDNPYTGDIDNWNVHEINWISGNDGVYNLMFSGTTNEAGGNFIDDINIECFYNNNSVHLINENSNDVILDINFNDNLQSFTDKNNSSVNFTVHKFNKESQVFGKVPFFSSEEFTSEEILLSSGTTLNINSNILQPDGEYILKTNFINNYPTTFLNKIGNTYSTFNVDSLYDYGIYNEETDFYFIVFKSANKPILERNFSNNIEQRILSETKLLENNQNEIILPNGNYSYIINLNGDVLSNEIDYQIDEIPTGDTTNKLLILYDTVVSGDTLNIIYVSLSDSFKLENKIIEVDNIISGTTNNQGFEDIYFNTNTNKFEVYTDSDINDFNDIIVIINGSILANNVDYYLSVSNPRRIILEGNLFENDLISIYYSSNADVFGNINNSTPIFSWLIQDLPNNELGFFTVEISYDENFSTIDFSGTTNYIMNTLTYFLPINLTGEIGDILYYRIKNTKIFETLTNNLIEDSVYSDIIKIKISTNSINTY